MPAPLVHILPAPPVAGSQQRNDGGGADPLSKKQLRLLKQRARYQKKRQNGYNSKTVGPKRKRGRPKKESPPLVTCSDLDSEYKPILLDRFGRNRGAFFRVPPLAMSCSKDFWKKNRNKAAFISRTSKSMKSFSLDKNGFQLSSSAKEFSAKSVVGRARIELTNAIETAIKRMGAGYLGGFEQTVDWRIGGIEGVLDFDQEPHGDFPWDMVLDESSASESSATTARCRKSLPFVQRVPFLVFFPLTASGMLIEIWDDVDPLLVASGPPKTSRIVRIPYGMALIVRGDTIHAGGIMTSPDGNPRAHLYVYQSGGTPFAVTAKNQYQLPDGTEMAECFLHNELRDSVGLNQVPAE